MSTGANMKRMPSNMTSRATLCVVVTLTVTTLFILLSQFAPTPSLTYLPGYGAFTKTETQDQAFESLSAKDQAVLPSQAANRAVTSPQARGQEVLLSQSKDQDVVSSEAELQGHASSDTPSSKSPLPSLPRNPVFITNSSIHKPRVPSESVKRNKTIVFFNRPSWLIASVQGCDVDACLVTDNQTEAEKADAVVFCMCCSLPDTLPFQPTLKQLWVAFGLESPPHCSNFRNPYSRKFNWTMTYRTDSDVFFPYGRLQLRQTPAGKNYIAIVTGKSKAVAWFVSNCNDRSQRLVYAKELSKHIPVDIYGDCGRLRCPRSAEMDCMHLLNTTYFFYLSFENSLCRDYMTEKVFKLYRNVDVIPVVRGGADYDQYLPPGTFLNTADFHSPRELAIRLKALMADEQAYAEMLKLKDRFWGVPAQYNSQEMCQLCKKLHENRDTKTYPDLQQWASEEVCTPANNV